MKFDKYDAELAIYSLLKSEWTAVDRERIVNLLTSGVQLTDAEARSLMGTVAVVEKKKMT